MAATFVTLPVVTQRSHPDQLLLNLCYKWHALYQRWKRELNYGYGGANTIYANELRPLLEAIAVMPAETDEGFEKKRTIIVDDVLPTYVWRLCKHQGTNRPYLLRSHEPISKARPVTRAA